VYQNLVETPKVVYEGVALVALEVAVLVVQEVLVALVRFSTHSDQPNSLGC
jgi:hypothetical protein